MAATGNWFIGTDNSVHITGLKDELGAYINAATSVIGTLKDIAGAVIPGCESIVFAYVAASAGNYDGIVPAIDTLTEKTEYDLFVVIMNAGRKFTGKIALKAAWYKL